MFSSACISQAITKTIVKIITKQLRQQVIFENVTTGQFCVRHWVQNSALRQGGGGTVLSWGHMLFGTPIPKTKSI